MRIKFFRDQDIWRGISFFVISSFAGEKKTKDKTSGTVKVFLVVQYMNKQ